MLTWIIVIVALLGTVLNVQQDRRSFLLWIGSNFALAVINAIAGEWAQATLWLAYVGMAVWGWVAWGMPRRLVIKDLCPSCENGYTGRKGNGYQPCSCRKGSTSPCS